jgi:hypothetical protein
MILCILMNLAILVLAVAAARAHAKEAPLREVMRYFTAQSNLLCAAAALLTAVCRLFGAVPNAVLLLKFAGTAAVTVTLLTVVFFLAPRLGFAKLFGGPDLYLHLVCPVLAIITHFAWDKPRMSFAGVFIGVLPVVLYGALYFYKVVCLPPEKGWPDLYGFNKSGKWPVSCAAMLLGSFAVSLLLWIV